MPTALLKMRRYTLTHRHLFLLGWTYYLALPLLLGHSGVFDSVSSLSLLGGYFDPQSPSWQALVLFCVLAPLAYLLGGAWTPLRAGALAPTVPDERRRGAWPLIPVYGALLALFTFQARSLLFTGYVESVEVSLLGPLATLQMLVLFQYLFERTAERHTASAFGWLLLLNSGVLLSLGGRLYVLSALVALYFRWWNWGARSGAQQLRSLILLLGAPAVLVAVGMWRVGATDYSLVGFYLVSESTFTSISGFTLFTGGQWSLLDMPGEFIAAFVNIVPSALWPGKAEWLIALTSASQNYESPFGAISIVASSVGNFGFLGALLFFFGVGAYMSTTGRTHRQPARIAHYSYLVGMLPFMFFRDPFQVQVKLVMTGFLLYWATVLLRSRQRPASVMVPDAAAATPAPASG